MTGIHKEKNKRPAVWIVLCMLVWIPCIILAVYLSLGYDAPDYKIDSPKKFITAINHSDETRQAYNYVITDSFDIDVVDLPKGKSFYGHLDGNGNTVTIVSEDGKPMVSPIFSKIQSEGSVERLCIKLNTVLGEDENVADIALLANDNFGKVQDCSISITDIFIGNKCLNAAGLVNNNFGEINSACININAVKSSQSVDNWQSAFGAISTTNYAIVKNVFTRVSFIGIGALNILYDNQNVGYLFGKIGIWGEKTNMNDIYLFGDSALWGLSTDAARMPYAEVIKGDKPNSSEVSEFIRYNGNANAWSASLVDENTGFPLLYCS